MAVGDRDGMDDLDRLFRHLVSVLADQAPERLHQPFEVAELYQQIVPYRQHRLALKFDTHQDYEMAVMRLLSGDRGYARVEPGEAQEVLRKEAVSVNPDLGLFREFAAARVTLDPAAVRTAMGARRAFAPSPPLERQSHGVTAAPPLPPAPRHGTTAAPPPPSPPHGMTASDYAARGTGRGGGGAVGTGGVVGGDAAVGEAEVSTCPYCGQELPAERAVFYCPFCGGNVKAVECPKCGTVLEVGWTFCITCGQKVERT